jgi:hypothetical protein
VGTSLFYFFYRLTVFKNWEHWHVLGEDKCRQDLWGGGGG